LAPNGDLFATDAEGNHILRVNPSTGAVAQVPEPAPFGSLESITAGPDGTLYVVDLGTGDPLSPNGDEAILRVDPSTGARTTISSGGQLRWPRGVKLAASGDLLVADQDAIGKNGAIIRIAIASGAQTILSEASALLNPQDLAIAASGNLVVTDLGDETLGADQYVFIVDPANGNATPLTQNGYLVNPWGVAVVGEPTCGNGQHDPGEQCDQGAQNGNGSCCTTACTFAVVGTQCRAADNDCDIPELCSGADAVCP